MHSRDSHAYQNNFFTIRNTAEAIFEWHVSRVPLDRTLVGELEHAKERNGRKSDVLG